MEWYYWTILGAWLFIFVATVIVEISTTGIISGLVSVAVLPSIFIAGFLGKELWSIPIQIGSAIVLWLILYFTSFKLLKTWFDKRNKYKGPVEDIIGREVGLLGDANEDTNANQKYAKAILNSIKYRVLAAKNQGLIPDGSRVKVVKIEGNTLFVERI